MSFGGEYETSKIGPTTRIAFNATAGVVKVIKLKPSGGKKTSFAIRARSFAARVRQGTSAATISATDVGLQISTTLRWRVDVEADTEIYLAVVGDEATGGDLEITKISDCADYASDETPAVV